MKDYLKRMYEELDELNERYEKLCRYNHSSETGEGKFASLSVMQMFWSMQQEADMKRYRDDLKKRIELAEEKGDGKD